MRISRWSPWEKALELDVPEPDPHGLVEGAYPNARRYARYLLRTAVEYRLDALCLVHIHAFDTTQIVSWVASTPDYWGQLRPPEGALGLAVIAFLRRNLRPRSRADSVREGWLRYRYGGVERRVRIWSPHAWEARVFLSDQVPTCPPYAVVYPYATSRAAEGSAGDAGQG